MTKSLSYLFVLLYVGDLNGDGDEDLFRPKIMVHKAQDGMSLSGIGNWTKLMFLYK